MVDRDVRLISPAWLAAGIVLVTFLFFSPSLGFDFLHSDDDVNVFENEHIRQIDAASLKWMFTDFQQAIRFKPISWLGWAIVYQFSGLDAFGYHLANVSLHAINGGLLFLLLVSLGTIEGRRPVLAALIATLFWCLHPLRVEPVAWVTGFPYHLTTCFLLLSLHAYLRIDRKISAFRQSSFWWAFLLYAVAIATYPIALGFVCALLALDVIRLASPGDSDLWRDVAGRLPEKIPFVMVAVVAAGITVLSRYQVDSAWGAASTAGDYNFARHGFQAGYVWGYYLWKPLLPVHLTPIPMDLIENETWSLPFVLSAGLLVVGTIVVVRNWRRRPGWIAFWFAHLGLLVPLLGLTEEYHFPSDRYAMLPGLLVSAAAVVYLRRLSIGRTLAVSLALVLTASAGQALSYLRIWQDDVTYFGYLGERLGDNLMRPAILDRLGDAHVRRDQLPEAIHSYRASLAGKAEYVPRETVFKLAAVLASSGELGEAEKWVRQGLARQPGKAGAWYLLGKILASGSRRDDAKKALRKAVELQPDFADAQTLLRDLQGEAPSLRR
jgi:protein O-mannosyl-transferase